MVFKELMIGDMKKAISSGACPGDSKFGIGNLFHMYTNVNFVNKKVDGGDHGHTFQIDIATTKEVTIAAKHIKHLVVWIGLGAVVAFFIAIMICKSQSKPLEVVENLEGPHATIGQADNVADDEYAKPAEAEEEAEE